MAEVLIEVSQGLALGDRQVIRTLLRIIECNFKIIMLIEPEELWNILELATKAQPAQTCFVLFGSR